MKKLFVLLALVLISTAAFAADPTATNTFTTTVVCPPTQYDGQDLSTAFVGTVVAGNTITPNSTLDWDFVNWGDNGEISATIAVADDYAGTGDVTYTETYGEVDMTPITGGWKFNSVKCNTTGAVTVTLNTVTATANAQATATVTITYTMTITAF